MGREGRLVPGKTFTLARVICYSYRHHKSTDKKVKRKQMADQNKGEQKKKVKFVEDSWPIRERLRTVM